jgi:hypothetical protein
MRARVFAAWSSFPFAMMVSACGGGPPSPTEPSVPQSFLAGTWRGNLTIQPNPTAPQPGSPVSGAVTWTFEVVPQTNLQTFRATVRSENPWLPITIVASTAIVPGNTPPAQISTQGDYDSPRGCRGSFGSFGTADATRIEADFTGVDCPVTFTGRVVLTKP